MSIPRLELQGGVLGTRLASSIKSSQTIQIEKQFFWTDSQDVMAWVNSEARKYKQFVALRIAEILDTSNPNEWRWLPSEHNVADEYVFRFAYNIRRKSSERRTGPLSQQELQEAENLLYRQAQTDYFLDEIVIMKANRSREKPKELD